MEKSQDEGPWIGPTECDEKRKTRTQEVNETWNKLKFKNSKLEWARLLFREALSCYQNGAFMATALLCRASTEAALYLSVTRSKELEGRTQIDLGFLDWKYGDILCQAKLKGIIDSEKETILKNIREKGNFSAHYAPKIDKCIHNLQVSMSNGAKDSKSINLWLNEEDAKNVLNWSVTILNALYEK